MSPRVPVNSGRSSLRAFARLLQVDPKAVRKGVASGRLRESVGRDRAGRPFIRDVTLAKREWAENAAQAKRSEGRTSTLAEAQRKVALERARGLKLANDVRRRKLILADEATRQAFEFARVVRENVLNLPARLSAQLAAETDPRQVFAMLDAELRKALVTTADQLERAS